MMRKTIVSSYVLRWRPILVSVKLCASSENVKEVIGMWFRGEDWGGKP